MADVRKRDVVMPAPEKGNIPERFPQPQHVARDRLALPLGDDPVLDANRLPEPWLGVARAITRGPDARRARAQESVHDNAVRDAQPRLFGETGARPHAHAKHDEVGGERATILEFDALRPDGARTRGQMESHSVRLVQLLNETAQVLAENALERQAVTAHDVHFETSRSQRGGGFKPDEARAHDDSAPCPAGCGNDSARIGQRAQCEYLRLIRA